MQNNFYNLYYFFDNPIVRWVRVVIFFGIGILVYINIGNPQLVIRILPLYFLLIVQEFFIHFKLENAAPKSLTHDTARLIESVDYKTRASIERVKKMQKVIEMLSTDSTIKYFNRLLEITYTKDGIEITEEEVLKKAQTLVTRVSGKSIHGIDVYAAFLLLADFQNKMLFQNDIAEQDVVAVLTWTRRQFKLDMEKHHGLQFTGSGAFDFFVYGWSAELSQYASNLTSEILASKHLEPIGRAREYDLLVTALTKSSSSNALLVGDAGVGKTTLVSQLVLDSNNGNLPRRVSNKLVFQLYPERLLAGINNEGDLQARIVNLFSELMHAGNIILYIPNIENIFGGGGLNVDLSGVLIEYLKGNRIKVIGSTTEESFKKFLYDKHEIKELFDVVEVEQADHETTLFMVLEKAKELEWVNHVTISYSAVKTACSLSTSYLNDGTVLPGSAIKLLEDTVSYTQTHGKKTISKKEVEEFVQEKTQILLSEPTAVESEKLLDLENLLHKQVISQDEAISAVSNAMRRVRSGMKNAEKPIATFLFIGPTGVGKTETAKALANAYFGNEDAMIRLDMSEYQNSDAVDRFLGSGGSQRTIVDKVLSNPFTEILLDEFEKAHPSILDLFLQILDEGRLTDNLGRTVSFNNTIIIATSNAGSEYIREMYKNGPMFDEKEKLIEKVLQMGIFKPELINRFDDVIAFKPLTEKDVVEVAKLFMNEVVQNMTQKQIILTYDIAVCEFIAKNSYSMEFGARNVKRFIEQSVENQLSKLILSNGLVNGNSATITVENNNLVIK